MKDNSIRQEFKTHSLKMNHVGFYSILNLIKKFPKNKTETLVHRKAKIQEFKKSIKNDFNILSSTKISMIDEIARSTKINPMLQYEEQDNAISKYSNTLNANFIGVSTAILELFLSYCDVLISVCDDLYPRDVLISDRVIKGNLSFEELQQITYEMQLNYGPVTRFVDGLFGLSDAQNALVDRVAIPISLLLERLNSTYTNRHNVQGVEIVRDPIITDLALLVYENIDAHGEIESGTEPDKISAFSLRKAELVATMVKSGLIRTFVECPGSFMEFIETSLNGLFEQAESLTSEFSHELSQIKNIDNRLIDSYFDINNYDNALIRINEQDPSSARTKENTKILSEEEIQSLKFRNETIKGVADILLQSNFSNKELIDYVLNRKHSLQKFFREVNSFYVCRIGNGNSFLGAAPGALEVIPGVKPNASLENVLGSGFGEVKEFLNQVRAAGKWRDLFLATSPSKTVDKSNALLIGPAGAGKTQVLRSIANEPDSISIFAQGSDFLTCWKGESDKNPKRLFESAVKLRKESGRHVYILIDEIDSVLKKQEYIAHSETNLTLEFQMLMDGVVNYSGISVWGTTNFPDRIPMPMIRRFSKIAIVGELSLDDRTNLLKHYVSDYLPVSEFTDEDWGRLAAALEGATGDIVRKVSDSLWRDKITEFISKDEKKAEELISHLNKDKKFNIATFDATNRAAFRSKLANSIKVTPKDVEKVIDNMIDNVAIRAEISNAVESYARAKLFMNTFGAMV